MLIYINENDSSSILNRLTNKRQLIWILDPDYAIVQFSLVYKFGKLNWKQLILEHFIPGTNKYIIVLYKIFKLPLRTHWHTYI